MNNIRTQWGVLERRHLAAIALLTMIGGAVPAVAAPTTTTRTTTTTGAPKSTATTACPVGNANCGSTPTGPIVADPRPDTYCGKVKRATIAASPATIPQGQGTTLSWSIEFEFPCTPPSTVTLNGRPVSASSSMSVWPMASQSYGLRLAGVPIANTVVNVQLPPVVRIDGSSSEWRHLLLQALNTSETKVVVAPHVEMNMTWLKNIPIAQGVVFSGGRTSREPGARFYVTETTRPLFLISGDRVRITGLRIEGPDVNVISDDSATLSTAIEGDSFVELQIDNNEIHGWSAAAISISDNGKQMSSASRPTAVRILNNYIHHNEHEGRMGYGVVVGNGAHAQIMRNAFDYNRHAIAGDGRPGTGFEAVGNLVLPNGGKHRWIAFPGTWTHTHQFDMHGRDSCGIGDLFSDTVFNCGPAGSLMIVRQNTFLYTAGATIKLRGTPGTDPQASALFPGMYIGDNVFKAPFLLNTVVNGTVFIGTVQQTESGLRIEPGNRTGIDGSKQLGSCDFDGDGVPEKFMATGATWWMSSGTQPWTYLNTSKKLLSELQLGDFDGDGYCDVKVDGVIYSRGTKVLNYLKPAGVLTR